ncbi:MAG: hypothetical protein AAGB51_01745 [Planctomycetota bacterium]
MHSTNENSKNTNVVRLGVGVAALAVIIGAGAIFGPRAIEAVTGSEEPTVEQVAADNGAEATIETPAE